MSEVRFFLVHKVPMPLPGDSPPLPREGVRTFASLAIFIHLFCVFVVLSSNLAPSSLQDRLVQFLAPYTRTLNFDPNFVPYHLTSGESIDAFHSVEVDTADGQTRRFPEGSWRGSIGRHRSSAVAHVIAFYAAGEVDHISAELAKAFGARVLLETKSDRAVVRCVRHDVPPRGPMSTSQENGQQRTPVYEADVWRDPDGFIQVLKRSAASEVATPESGV